MFSNNQFSDKECRLYKVFEVKTRKANKPGTEVLENYKCFSSFISNKDIPAEANITMPFPSNGFQKTSSFVSSSSCPNQSSNNYFYPPPNYIDPWILFDFFKPRLISFVRFVTLKGVDNMVIFNNIEVRIGYSDDPTNHLKNNAFFGIYTKSTYIEGETVLFKVLNL